MRYSSHCRAISAPPCYQASRTTLSRETDALTAPAFLDEFHGARNAHKRIGNDRSIHARANPDSPAVSPWSAAFTLMLVANLLAPPALASPMVPRIPRIPHMSGRQHDADNAPGIAPELVTAPPPEAPTDMYREVEMHSIDRPWVKSDYTAQQFLRALASASAPFRNLGRMIGETYRTMSGEALDPPTREMAQDVGIALDAATGLIPNVQLTRLPGQLADMTADALDGMLPNPFKIADLVKFGDPRAYGGEMPMHHKSASTHPSPAGRAPMIEPAAVNEVDAFPPAAPPVGENRAEGVVDARAALEGEDVEAAAPETNDAVADPAMSIEGEREHLQGYEQPLPSEQIPPGARRRMIHVNGRDYLAGESGYYHVTPGQRAGHWLINAPRGAGAQVPVIHEARTGTWRADAPLRVCGGGCAPSREAAPDSVAMSENDVGDAIRHLPEPEVRDAIQWAYDDLAQLHLLRANREDLRPLRDYSIVEHRHALVPQLMRIDRRLTLFEQQREAARMTADHYSHHAESGPAHLSPEAYCFENAAILFHSLLTRGVPGHHLRMITAKSKGVSGHVMVLYTKAGPFIDLLDATTPQPPLAGHLDGISDDLFAGALFLTRGSTVLLDPWSRIKASSFSEARNVDDVRRLMEIALADTGRDPASPYTVSLTRPSPSTRERAA